MCFFSFYYSNIYDVKTCRPTIPFLAAADKKGPTDVWSDWQINKSSGFLGKILDMPNLLVSRLEAFLIVHAYKSFWPTKYDNFNCMVYQWQVNHDAHAVQWEDKRNWTADKLICPRRSFSFHSSFAFSTRRRDLSARGTGPVNILILEWIMDLRLFSVCRIQTCLLVHNSALNLPGCVSMKLMDMGLFLPPSEWSEWTPFGGGGFLWTLSTGYGSCCHFSSTRFFLRNL